MVQELLIDLSRALILIRYQKAREQLSESLALNLELIVRTVVDKLKSALAPGSKTNIDDVVNVMTSARTLLDAFATLVYTYGR